MIDFKNRYILTKDYKIIDLNKYNTENIYFEPFYIKNNLVFSMKCNDETIISSSQIRSIITEPTYAIGSTKSDDEKYEVEIDHSIKGIVYYDKDKECKYIKTECGNLDFEEFRDRITKVIVTWKIKGGETKTKILFIKNFKGKYIFEV